MDAIYSVLKGPVFIFCFSAMLLGLVRAVAILVLGMFHAVKKAGDKNIPYKALFIETLGWLIPLRHITATRAFFSISSFLFHLGLVIVPLLLLDHILLFRSGIGVSWPAIPKLIADFLTLVSLGTGILLLANRIADRNTRFISGFIDYFLLILILTIFSTGYIASRPYNPLSHQATMIIHVCCGNLILLIIPFTKLAHCILFPLVRFASNIAWHFPAHAGEKINKLLYNEEIRKI